MKIELTQIPLLSPQQIGELAASLDSIHTRVIKTIERLQKIIEGLRSVPVNVEIKVQPVEKETERDSPVDVRGVIQQGQ